MAAAIAEMQLRHAVITSVDRDDLPDFGAYIFAETIRQIKQRLPDCSVEVLVPDFQGNEDSIRTVLEAGPDIYNHNTETVPRLYKRCRPGGRYERVHADLPDRQAHRAAHPDEDRHHPRHG